MVNKISEKDVTSKEPLSHGGVAMGFNHDNPSGETPSEKILDDLIDKARELCKRDYTGNTLNGIMDGIKDNLRFIEDIANLKKESEEDGT